MYGGPGTHNMGLGLSELLIGADPLDVEGAVGAAVRGFGDERTAGSGYQCDRRARYRPHDLRGKALGKPCYELLGGAVRDSVTPVRVAQPETSSFEEYLESMVDWAQRAVAAVSGRQGRGDARGPVRTTGLREPWDRSTRFWRRSGRQSGPNGALVDVQYAFPDADTALDVMGTGRIDLVFVETPLWPDDLDGLSAAGRGQLDPDRLGRVADDAL